MAKKGKLSTPDWIREGYDSKQAYEKAKGLGKKKKAGKKERKFSVKFCPQCKSQDVGVVIGGQIGLWECHKCKHQGPSFPEVEVSEDEYLDFIEKLEGK